MRRFSPPLAPSSKSRTGRPERAVSHSRPQIRAAERPTSLVWHCRASSSRTAAPCSSSTAAKASHAAGGSSAVPPVEG